MRSYEVFKVIKESGIVAIMRELSEEEALYTAEALHKGGLKAVEVTFNTPDADKILSRIREEFKEDILVGAGTVTNIVNARKAIKCGAEFILAPNIDEEVISLVKKYEKLMIPGAFTATEVLKCHNLGADIVKIFPVSSVGPRYIKDLRGPYNHINMMPVGGVDLQNTGEFFKAGAIAVGAGSSLISKKMLAAKDYKGIEELAKRFVEEAHVSALLKEQDE